MRTSAALVCTITLIAGTAMAYPLPQLVVAAYVETVILPGYSGSMAYARERLVKECPLMFSRATMEQITCEQFMRAVAQAQFQTFLLIGGRGEYAFVATEYSADRSSAIVAVQITRRDSRGRVERQYVQTHRTVLEDGTWRIQLEERIVAAIRGVPGSASPTPSPSVRTVALNVRSSAGPITASVTSVEFASDSTTLTLSVENAANVEANLFSAIGNAKLTDNAGKTYNVRMLRSDLADRVMARASIRGRLAFEPLASPPGLRSMTLSLPSIQVGDTTHDITIEMRF